MVKRINELIKDIDRNGLLIGTGKPEPLKYRKACSRRITDEHRLVSNMIAHCIWLFCRKMEDKAQKEYE
ncbi:type II toxin-antitoxin system YoeB family toxin [Acetivibrio ethanolgignens]|uniref:type II toxin-antitoxin system YoeB family toxin n=1 Tax=Acetivibrio ethanolgignens TaxID=290052 RepID=UPI0009F93BBF|nr:type II toxin-antitoxin system YoeB family toxin [Acetivibrio ethanolgignens]